ncbi:hypothetical protein HME9304_01407 [Flagellimonas maritima]|uniref:Uncharacterized protein n=1 Tax=Flagellimonas maritima TaxID=1383885 RepID=A0A2Z4LT05_9FLAO|nr:DUF5916 domain-containing protein [Allomuricauda aurantiaca]AWX44407.1 hypothetical protein HME9304_01407 [Allomuricauda aurantiaca]
MRRVFFSFVLLAPFFSQGQTEIIGYSESEINVDGKPNEPIWETLPEITGFYNYLPTDEGLAEQQTRVRLFTDDEFLYVSAIYEDTEPKIQTSSLKRDVSIGISDSFILVLDTQNQKQSAFYFAVNGYGTQVDGLVERINEGYGFSLSWNAVWKAAATADGNLKMYEMAIPLKALNYDVDNPTIGIQMYVRDIKKNAWSILTNVKRNYRLYDLRFTRPFRFEQLPDISPSRFAVTPSVTVNSSQDVLNDSESTIFQPSLDVQYNLTSSLKLDATINPDFSQIDVDQQVTNLTRFDIFFPEQRNFFLENADLFSNLGVGDVNPFYSRRIGADTDIQFGLKLSGNLTKKTRIGFLDVQTDSEQDIPSQNYAALVVEQQLTNNFSTTGFLINRQETDGFELKEDYNRVTGLNINYKSNDNKWIGLANYAKSFSDGITDKNSFYNAGIWYNRRGLGWNASVRNIGKNYIADVGFTPRLFNFDAVNDEVVREGYTQASAGFEYEKFYDSSQSLNSFRILNYSNDTYLDEQGNFNQSSHFLNSALFFKDLSAIYYVLRYDDIDLKYGFDPLGNGNPLQPDRYDFGSLKVGYNSANNQNFIYQASLQHGEYYSGKRTTASLYTNYQFLPFANFILSYDLNNIDLDNLGEETFHLARFTGEVFFNTRLNWTTYIQYNTQADNFNINSRLQWEYKPLSYIYLVVTDNYTQDIERTNWGVAFKMNYRMDF